MRILFTTLPLYGHFFPMVPLSWALRCAGHEVLVGVAAADFSGAVNATGLAVAVTAGLSLHDYADANGKGTNDERAAGLHASLAASGHGWARLAWRALDGMVGLVDSWRPDVVVSDPCEYAGRLAAGRFGVPWIEHSWGLAAPREFRAAAAAELGALDAALTVPLDRPALTLYPCPPTLQHADAPPGTYLRYVPYNGPATFPDWLPTVRNGRPRVCLTFGSVLPIYGASDLEDLLLGILTELSALGVEIVLGIDDKRARALRPQFPDGVRHAGWLSLDQVLPHCDLAVHHGGAGTSMTTLVHRLPQLLLPQATDQFGTSDRFCATGAARRLLPGEVSDVAIRSVVEELLNERCYRDRAEALADELAAQETPTAVVDKLDRLVRAHR